MNSKHSLSSPWHGIPGAGGTFGKTVTEQKEFTFALLTKRDVISLQLSLNKISEVCGNMNLEFLLVSSG